MTNNIRHKLQKSLEKAAEKAGIVNPSVTLEHPDEISHGDFSTNIAMAYAKTLKQNPRALAEKIVEEFKKDVPDEVAMAEIAGPGFLNIRLKEEFFIKGVLEIGEKFGMNTNSKGQKIIIEHTQPNPFKEFHIGHLMNNTVGESLSRILSFSGAEIRKVTYHGDVGLHVAKTIWGFIKSGTNEMTVDALGKSYATGTAAYDDDENTRREIIELNKKIYTKNDQKINELYEKGRKISLNHFEELYSRLGSTFDNHFYESESGEIGKKIVLDFINKNVFEKGDGGAVVFRGENFEPKTHTRVFLNSENLPTYEAKEVGLAAMKKKYYSYNFSLTITASEQDAFFNVVEVAIANVFPDLKGKLLHISHGMLRLTTGKMSSRTGSVISAEDFIDDLKKLVIEKIKDRNFDSAEKEKLAEEVAIAAIKYQVLRQAIGGDIIYDPEKSISFEGDSGPYLQYSCVRAGTVIAKAKEAGIGSISFVSKIFGKKIATPDQASLLEKMLLRFPEVVERAREDHAPHHVTTYLTELAATFNSYYSNNQIIDKENPLSPYRVALTVAFRNVMKNGLWLLGIKVPRRM